MEWRERFRMLLIEEFEHRRQRNARYSVRSFAAAMKVSPATLSQVLRGIAKWQISPQRALGMLENARISDTTVQWLARRMGEADEPPKNRLDSSRYSMLTDWLYSVIFVFHELPEGLHDPKVISEKTGASVDQVNTVIEELIQSGVLKRNIETGKVEADMSGVTSGDGPPNEYVRRHHRDALSLAIRALDHVEPEKRDFTTLTFKGSQKNLEKVQAEIRRFHNKIASLMDENESNDQVFRMSVALFPVELLTTQSSTDTKGAH